MQTIETRAKVHFGHILYLTDFSEPSAAALPYAATLGRRYRGKVHALHILMPPSNFYITPGLTDAVINEAEESARAEMQKVDSQLAGLQHDTIVTRGVRVWPAAKEAVHDEGIDLVVLGTHGRTGAEKFLMGSVAEEIFRRSPVPVMTIGPSVRSSTHNGGHFHRVLFATDFTPESLIGAPYAISLAMENHAHLLLLVVMRKPKPVNDVDVRIFEVSVAEALHRLRELVPPDANLAFEPETIIEYGEPAERIVETAKQRGADLIVMGVRSAEGRMSAATHLERAIAHKVVVHASCPVLTVRDETKGAELVGVKTIR